MPALQRKFLAEDPGQDIAEYAVMLAVILVIVIGAVQLIGSNANNVFSNVASSLQSDVTPNPQHEGEKDDERCEWQRKA